jgi:hypothetical protein
MKVLLALFYPAVAALRDGRVALGLALLAVALGFVGCVATFEWKGG